jgi:hypothetical protein
MWDFVMDKGGAGAGFVRELRFPCQSTFHLLLHNHLHYHPRVVQQARSGRSANTLTNQNNNKKILLAEANETI